MSTPAPGAALAAVLAWPSNDAAARSRIGTPVAYGGCDASVSNCFGRAPREAASLAVAQNVDEYEMCTGRAPRSLFSGTAPAILRALGVTSTSSRPSPAATNPHVIDKQPASADEARS